MRPMMQRRTPGASSGPRLLRVWSVVGAMLSSLAGCDGLFEVENPGAISSETLETPALREIVRASGEGALLDSWAIGTRLSGLATDELFNAYTLTNFHRIDQGFFDSDNSRAGSLGLVQAWSAMSEARWMANYADSLVTLFSDSPSDDPVVARVRIVNALAQVIMADIWTAIVYDGGPPVTPDSVYSRAIAQATEALTIATNAGNANLRAYALGLRARVRHSLWIERGSTDAALLNAAAQDATDALVVDSDFSFVGVFGSFQTNPLAFIGEGSCSFCPDPTFRNWRDAVTAAADPRLPMGPFQELGQLPGDSVFEQRKYENDNSPANLVKWQEMNLILAEWNMVNGDVPNGAARLNLNRTAVGLPDMNPTTVAELRDAIIAERAVEFWIEGGRRWMDMRRFDLLPESRWLAAATAQGTNRKFPIPDNERILNPNVD